jgi:hypothetical protein
LTGTQHEAVRQSLPPRRDTAPGYDSRGSTAIAEATARILARKCPLLDDGSV